MSDQTSEPTPMAVHSSSPIAASDHSSPSIAAVIVAVKAPDAVPPFTKVALTPLDAVIARLGVAWALVTNLPIAVAVTLIDATASCNLTLIADEVSVIAAETEADTVLTGVITAEKDAAPVTDALFVLILVAALRAVIAALTDDAMVLSLTATDDVVATIEAVAIASVKLRLSNCSRLPKPSRASIVPQLSNSSRVAMPYPLSRLIRPDHLSEYAGCRR